MEIFQELRCDAYGIRQGDVVRIAHHQGSVALRIVILPIYFIDIPFLHPSVLTLPAVVLHRFQLFHRWPAPVFLPEAVRFPRRHSIRCHLADQLRQMPRPAVTRRGVSALMSREAGARTVAVTVLSRLRCISFRTYMYHVRSAKVRDITEKPWK